MSDTFGTLGFVFASSADSNLPSEAPDKGLKGGIDTSKNIQLTIKKQTVLESFDETTYSHQFGKTGAASITNIGGRSIVWNQLYQADSGGASYSGIQAEREGNKLHLYGTAGSECYPWITNSNNTPTIKDHKYYVRNKVEGDYEQMSNKKLVIKPFGASGEYTEYTMDFNTAEIITETTGQSEKIKSSMEMAKGEKVDMTAQAEIFDLTKMFGAGNEPTVEQFEAMFPEEYYEYSAPTIKSADVSSVDVEGQTITVPAAVRQLPGYGWSTGQVCNEVDYANKKYIQRVFRVTLNVDDMHGALQKYPGWQAAGVKDYIINTNGARVGLFERRDLCTAEVCWIGFNTTKGQDTLFFQQENYSGRTEDQWKSEFAGETFNFYLPMDNPIITDISSLLSGEMIDFGVSNGDTVTFKQADDTKRLPVPVKGQVIIY